MQYDEFIRRVQGRARLSDRRSTERSVRATLETLGETLMSVEASNLAAQLPGEAARWLEEAALTEAPGAGYDVDEFCGLVAERAGLATGEVHQHIRATMGVVRRAVGEGQWTDTLDALPRGYDDLTATDPAWPGMDRGEFLDAVADRAGLADRDDALFASLAVIQTLGERVTDGQAYDVAQQLPEELATALRDAGDRVPDASVFDLESFCQRTAERAGRHGDTDAGQELGRAVLATLRAAIDPAEWEALIAQLPDAYEPILS